MLRVVRWQSFAFWLELLCVFLVRVNIISISSKFLFWEHLCCSLICCNIVPWKSIRGCFYFHLHSILNNLAPSYVRNLLIPYIPSCQLRTSSKNLLYVPRFNLRSSYGARSFSVAVPTLWNTLPFVMKNSSAVSVFKNRRKTFLFKKAFF